MKHKYRIFLAKFRSPIYTQREFYGGISSRTAIVLEPSIKPGTKTVFRLKNGAYRKKPSIFNSSGARLKPISIALLDESSEIFNNIEIIWESSYLSYDKWKSYAINCIFELSNENRKSLIDYVTNKISV